MNNLLVHIKSFDTGLPLAITALLLFIFSAYFLGFTTFKTLLKIDIKNKAIETIAFIVIGFDILSFCIIILAYARLINEQFTWPFLIISGLAGIFTAVKNFRPSKIQLKSSLSIIFLIAFFAILTLGSAISYPIGWDELVYHISIPYRWQADGFPLIYKDNPFSGFPSSPEFVFWFLISAAGIKTVRLAIWFLNIIFLSCLYLLIKDNSSKIRTVLFVASLSFAPVFMMLAREAYAEIIILLNLTASILLVRTFGSKTNIYKIAVITGIMGASCINVKLTGIAALLVIFIFAMPYIKEYSRFFKFTAFFSLISFIIAFPFYLRPFMATGNPFYPYFAKFFTTAPATLCMSMYQHDAGSLKFGMQSISSFFSTPILLAFDLPNYDGSFGLQFLILFLLALIALLKMFSDKKLYGTGKILFALLFLYTFWFFSSQQARFLIPFFVLLLFFISQAMNKNPLLRSGIFPLLLAVLTAISIPGLALKHYYNTWKMSLNKDDLLNYIYSGTGDDYLPAVAMLSNLNEKNPKILMLFDNRTLYIPHKKEIGTPFFQEKYFTDLMFSGKPDIPSMKKEIIEGKFTHIMMSLTNKDPDRMDKYLEQLIPFAENMKYLESEGFLKKIHESGNTIIFQVTAQK